MFGLGDLIFGLAKINIEYLMGIIYHVHIVIFGSEYQTSHIFWTLHFEGQTFQICVVDTYHIIL
jgi:hypothetical protein